MAAKKVAELWLAARHDFVNQPTVLERLIVAATADHDRACVLFDDTLL
jgi:hypothetical protein